MSAAVLAALLVRSLTDYAKQCRSTGMPVPGEVDVLLRGLSSLLTATTGHNRPHLAGYSELLDVPSDAGAMSYSQAAERLGVSHRTIRRYVQRGTLRTAGRRVLTADVERLAGRDAA